MVVTEMIFKVVDLITTQKAIIQTLVKVLVYQRMLIVFQLSIKDNQMLSKELAVYQNKVAKLTLDHQALNNHHKQSV
jgi:hypothetical protein